MGVVAFISNGAWIDGNAQEGFRKCLEDEYSSIYVLNLRGNQRTSGELSRKEGGKIFGSGSRTPISITLLVKNPAKKGKRRFIIMISVIIYHVSRSLKRLVSLVPLILVNYSGRLLLRMRKGTGLIREGMCLTH